MKNILAFALLAATVAVPAAAHAGDVRLGAVFLASPDGTKSHDIPGEESLSQDLDPSYGVAALIGYDVLPSLTVALAPGALFDVGYSNDGEGWSEEFTELDLAVRITGRLPVGRGVELQLHLAPGYSWVLPSEENITPRGWIIGLGGGVSVPVSSRFTIVGEVGKTYGYQGVTGRAYHGPYLPETVGTIGHGLETVRLGLGVQATL